MALLAMACESSPDNEVVNQLKDMNKRLKSIEAKLDNQAKGGPAIGAAGARGAPGQRPGMDPSGRPPGPDPAEVYAVPIAGAPYLGPEKAKVTIVEAFDFA
ncbi:MAG TPA: hypothetical protein VL172_17015 [Kofleriaceae bacterium]|nr:hypothetical protein [Kofleriaceae bacterium]